MLRPYRINNLKTGFIDPAKLNSTLLWNQRITWLLGLLLSFRPQSLACMQTFKTPHKSLFRFSYYMCYWFSPFSSCKHQCFLLPLIVWHLWLSLSDFAQTWQPGHSFSSEMTCLCLQTRLASGTTSPLEETSLWPRAWRLWWWAACSSLSSQDVPPLHMSFTVLRTWWEYCI